MLDFAGCDEVWFVVSPQNPLKSGHDMLDGHKRLELVKLAVEGNEKLVACDVELHMDSPSYTIHTLHALRQSFPDHSFALIMGADNLSLLHMWKDHDIILRDYRILVYPRPGHLAAATQYHDHIIEVDAPLIDISSTSIRHMFAERKNPRYMLPGAVYQKISLESYYAKD